MIVLKMFKNQPGSDPESGAGAAMTKSWLPIRERTRGAFNGGAKEISKISAV